MGTCVVFRNDTYKALFLAISNLRRRASHDADALLHATTRAHLHHVTR